MLAKAKVAGIGDNPWAVSGLPHSPPPGQAPNLAACHSGFLYLLSANLYKLQTIVSISVIQYQFVLKMSACSCSPEPTPSVSPELPMATVPTMEASQRASIGGITGNSSPEVEQLFCSKFWLPSSPLKGPPRSPVISRPRTLQNADSKMRRSRSPLSTRKH